MGEYINPGNLKKIFMEYFLGSQELFVFALLLIVSYACAYFQISNRNFGLILVISSIVFSVYLGQAFYFLILVVLGFILFKGFGRMFA